ncbi:hypothetical protein LILAB_00345 [Corallococcus macrosporus]|uniref:Uncharacterized protein n=2 Tax=Myxococcaceae TaxID=31 RepID=F8C8F7_MYXFH|nr:hypothetical protein LILAB_00345 [Corallococcus macrosporus]
MRQGTSRAAGTNAPPLAGLKESAMSISLLNRSCSSLPQVGVPYVPSAASPAPDVKGTQASPPRSDAWQKLMTDAFEPAARGQGVNLSGVSSAPRAASASHVSDAGPGFGAPSSGAVYNASQPWLSVNNVGSPYNSNMQLISPEQKSQFKFTNTFTNTTGQPQTITLWNKVGEKGGPNDGQNFDKSTPKTFTLQPGQSQMVAFDNNSSVAWCMSKDGSAKPGANSGQTWGEATFGNAATGWSGYNTSQITPAGHTGSMSITNEATGKTVTEANAWQTPSDDPAGRDVGVPAGPMHLRTVLS